MIHFFLKVLWVSVAKLVPKDKSLVVIATFPDFDDTTHALINALQGSRYRVVVLQKFGGSAPDWASRPFIRCYKKKSFRGVFAYHRAKWVYFTHGLYSIFPKCKQQTVINLWHGMPIKKIGSMHEADEILPKSDLLLACDTNYREIMSAVFCLPQSSVIIAQHPRVDMMSDVSRNELGDILCGKKLILWLPTYRRSSVGVIRSDGRQSYSLLDELRNFQILDRTLSRLGLLCVVKPHPMELLGLKGDLDFVSIKVWTDQDLVDNKVSLYQLLGRSAALITDASSVYFEYRHLNRPIYCFFPDFDDYRINRGFVRQFESLIQLQRLTEEAELCKLIAADFKTSREEEESGGDSCPKGTSHARIVLKASGMEL